MILNEIFNIIDTIQLRFRIHRIFFLVINIIFRMHFIILNAV